MARIVVVLLVVLFSLGWLAWDWLAPHGYYGGAMLVFYVLAPLSLSLPIWNFWFWATTLALFAVVSWLNDSLVMGAVAIVGLWAVWGMVV